MRTMFEETGIWTKAKTKNSLVLTLFSLFDFHLKTVLLSGQSVIGAGDCTGPSHVHAEQVELFSGISSAKQNYFVHAWMFERNALQTKSEIDYRTEKLRKATAVYFIVVIIMILLQIETRVKIWMSHSSAHKLGES